MMKCVCFIEEESDLIDTMVTLTSNGETIEESDSIDTSDNDATNEECDSIVTSDVEEATKETKVDDVVSLPFLEKDYSFFSPWSWIPDNAFNNDNASTKENKYLSFQPESYFTYQVKFFHCLKFLND